MWIVPLSRVSPPADPARASRCIAGARCALVGEVAGKCRGPARSLEVRGRTLAPLRRRLKMIFAEDNRYLPFISHQSDALRSSGGYS